MAPPSDRVIAFAGGDQRRRRALPFFYLVIWRYPVQRGELSRIGRGPKVVDPGRRAGDAIVSEQVEHGDVDQRGPEQVRLLLNRGGRDESRYAAAVRNHLPRRRVLVCPQPLGRCDVVIDGRLPPLAPPGLMP